MVKIEKNIDMPPGPGSGRPMKYPWLDMEVDQSFVLPAPNIANARAHCTGANSRYAPRKFSVRFYKGEFRVWRVK
jgi:hypothetical protein